MRDLGGVLEGSWIGLGGVLEGSWGCLGGGLGGVLEGSWESLGGVGEGPKEDDAGRPSGRILPEVLPCLDQWCNGKHACLVCERCRFNPCLGHVHLGSHVT